MFFHQLPRIVSGIIQYLDFLFTLILHLFSYFMLELSPHFCCCYWALSKVSAHRCDGIFINTASGIFHIYFRILCNRSLGAEAECIFAPRTGNEFR